LNPRFLIPDRRTHLLSEHRRSFEHPDASITGLFNLLQTLLLDFLLDP
jgi:hypothetical protein